MNSFPTERDFEADDGDLDAQMAWRMLGGLTVEEANAKFDENPEHCQEAFMFMGSRAFAFYFPVIEGHLRGVPDANNYDDDGAWILAARIRNQFMFPVPEVLHLAKQVLELADFVLGSLRRLGDKGDRDRVKKAWTRGVHK